MNAELCNMCMLQDAEGRVLVQERLPKPTNPWCGLTFPGGHLEAGESMVDSVIREMKEETGLTVSNLQSCGYIQWYKEQSQQQYIVFLFKSNSFSGEIKSSSEGRVFWMPLDEMLASKSLAPNMDKYIEVFVKENVPQAYGVFGGTLSVCES